MSIDPKDPIKTYDDFLKAQASEIDRLSDSSEIVAVDPDVADYMGAFIEEALSPEDAIDSMENNGEAFIHG